jgi:hypothetical protein
VAVLASDTKRIASRNEIPQKPAVSQTENFLASAHLEFEKGDIEALRGVYKRAKATRGVSADLLNKIEELAKGLKK